MSLPLVVPIARGTVARDASTDTTVLALEGLPGACVVGPFRASGWLGFALDCVGAWVGERRGR